MKKIKVVGIVSLVFGLAFAVSWFLSEKPIQLGHSKLAYYADNLDTLIQDSPIIIEGIASTTQDNLSLGGVSFVQTKINVKDVLKGELDEGSDIWLLQTKIVEDPIIEKSGHVLLFLEKYSGPVTKENAYVSKGLFQGHYQVKHDLELVPSLAESNKKLALEIKSIQLKDMKEKIAKTKGREQ